MYRHWIGLFRPWRQTLAWCVPASIFASLLLVPVPAVVRHLFDVVIPERDLSKLVTFTILILGVYIVESLLSMHVRSVIQKVVKDTVARMREQILQQLYRRSYAFSVNNDHARLHTTIVQDTERVDAMSQATLAQLLPASLSVAALSVLLLVLNWQLFLVTLFSLPLFFLMSRAANRRVRSSVQRFHNSFESFSKGVLFVLQNFLLTKSHSAEVGEMERQRNHIQELRTRSETYSRQKSAHIAVQNITAAVTMTLVLLAGGAAVIYQWITIGGLLSFYVALSLWRNALSSFSQALPAIAEGSESWKRIQPLLKSEQELYSGKQKLQFSGAISLEQVSFGYSGAALLDKIDLSIRPSEFVILLGPNGAGKTTIANLILGFYKPLHGTITADGIPFEDVDLAHLRSMFGVVPQDATPFHATVLENICYGNAAVNLSDVEEAAALTGADEFIELLPERYDTRIGEEGMILSGGQRQLLAITRALLRKPKLLILDEPSKHLDDVALERIVYALKNANFAPAILLISHEEKLIRVANQVYTLTQGKLTARVLHASA